MIDSLRSGSRRLRVRLPVTNRSQNRKQCCFHHSMSPVVPSASATMGSICKGAIGSGVVFHRKSKSRLRMPLSEPPKSLLPEVRRDLQPANRRTAGRASCAFRSTAQNDRPPPPEGRERKRKGSQHAAHQIRPPRRARRSPRFQIFRTPVINSLREICQTASPRRCNLRSSGGLPRTESRSPWWAI
jgi:hypothetical protein